MAKVHGAQFAFLFISHLLFPIYPCIVHRMSECMVRHLSRVLVCVRIRIGVCVGVRVGVRLICDRFVVASGELHIVEPSNPQSNHLLTKEST